MYILEVVSAFFCLHLFIVFLSTLLPVTHMEQC